MTLDGTRRLRLIPAIEQLRQRPGAQALEARYGSQATVEALRQEAAALRGELLAQTAEGTGQTVVSTEQAANLIERRGAQRLATAFVPSLGRVMNATGVIVHTNLGRAPLSATAVQHLTEVATAYTNLEYDVRSGRRGHRSLHAEALLQRLTGAEAGVVVNNNAAAVMLVLGALARGREVVISRGELVEIGGGFRVPEILGESGALLREVGTTNRTRAADYASAIGPRTALILRVHPSNFRIEGFTERPTLAEVVGIGQRFDIPVAEDLGSGNLVDLSDLMASSAGGEGAVRDAHLLEPVVRSSVEAGADLVCFSGDKLLGGPQAGIIVGRRPCVDRLRSHPLMRAVRVDKLTYAALEATLLEYAAGRATAVPVLRMIATPIEAIDARVRRLAGKLGILSDVETAVVDGVSAIGGGSAPGATIPTRLLVLKVGDERPDATEARLRTLTPPVIARIESDRLVLDLRTVLPEQDELLARLLTSLGVRPPAA